MGNLWSLSKEPSPPMVLMPPVFDFPPPATRTSFRLLAIRCSFDDYFEDAKHLSTNPLVKPTDDPHFSGFATTIVMHSLLNYLFFMDIYNRLTWLEQSNSGKQLTNNSKSQNQAIVGILRRSTMTSKRIYEGEQGNTQRRPWYWRRFALRRSFQIRWVLSEY
ncbi:hypothetical protein M8C21_001784 [Ambrosia artemisiifolia]|uniref:Uncharacterized protein n=1 Tax=Ambrosia artemisiifolia TaxID=4212 RepID=A0AAD5CAZ0_AMBAR|nr:hypothetical protein M8C21_001784 [Ambrosia artemisiifolia]